MKLKIWVFMTVLKNGLVILESFASPLFGALLGLNCPRESIYI